MNSCDKQRVFFGRGDLKGSHTIELPWREDSGDIFISKAADVANDGFVEFGLPVELIQAALTFSQGLLRHTDNTREVLGTAIVARRTRH